MNYERGLPLAEISILGPKGSVRYKGYLDTGASWVSAKPEDIKILDLEYLGEMPLYTAAGLLVVKLYLGKTVFLGKEFPTSIFPLDIPKEHGFDCLIGMNVMCYYKICFDNRKKTLEIE